MGNVISINSFSEKKIIRESEESRILSDIHKKTILTRFDELSRKITDSDLICIRDEVPRKLLEVNGSLDFIIKLKKRVQLLYRILFDPEYQTSPVLLKTSAAGLKYFISPRDFLNDEIPGLGYLDDAYVLGEVLTRNWDDLLAYLQKNNLNKQDFL